MNIVKGLVKNTLSILLSILVLISWFATMFSYRTKYDLMSCLISFALTIYWISKSTK